MKISIITATYNSSYTVRDTLECIQNQTYNNIEHIIVDGLSNDGTIDIIRSYPHVATIISEKDSGIYDAMNKGVALASGDIIGILNSDDIYISNNVLETIVNSFCFYTNVDIIYGDLVYVNLESDERVIRKWKSIDYYPSFFEDGNIPPHPCLFLRASVYKVAGNFNVSFKLAADYEFMLRIFKKFNFNSLHLDEVFVIMRLGGATNKSFLNVIRQNIEIIRAWKSNNIVVPILLMPKRFILRLKQFY